MDQIYMIKMKECLILHEIIIIQNKINLVDYNFRI